MIINEYGQCTRTEDEILSMLLENPNLERAYALIKTKLEVDSYNDCIKSHYLETPFAREHPILETDLDTFHSENQSKWFMPIQYQQLDIAEWLLSQCTTDEEFTRIGEELLLYADKNLLPVLQYLKYLIDTFRENDLVWGVGRGSCTSSYVLYKIGVHKIDSLKYDLDINEFLKE